MAIRVPVVVVIDIEIRTHGCEVTRRGSKFSGSKAKIVFTLNSSKDRNIKQIQISPGSSRHGNVPYVKISTSDYGKIKIIGADREAYKTDGHEKAHILFRRVKKKMIKEQNMTPYVGVGPIALMSRLDDVKAHLKSNKIPHQIEVWPNKGETPEVPWTVVRVEGCVSLFFAKEFLWKVYATRGYEGALPNGIRIGIKTEKALQMDPDLEDDDWNEVYVSKNGYWLEDSLETGEIESISVFIKAVENDDEFYSYEWASGNKIVN